VDSASQPWWSSALASRNELHLSFGPAAYQAVAGAVDPKTGLPTISPANLLHAPKVAASITDSKGTTVRNVLVFNSSSAAAPAFVDLSSRWNGFVSPTNSFMLGGGGGFQMVATVLFHDVQTPQSLLDYGTDPHACGSELDQSSRPATETRCAGQLSLTVNGGKFAATHAAAGYPYNSTEVSTPVAAGLWCHLNLTALVEQPRHGSARAVHWTLALNGEVVASVRSAGLPIHLGLPAFAVLGSSSTASEHRGALGPFTGWLGGLDFAPLKVTRK